MGLLSSFGWSWANMKNIDILIQYFFELSAIIYYKYKIHSNIKQLTICIFYHVKFLDYEEFTDSQTILLKHCEILKKSSKIDISA